MTTKREALAGFDAETFKAARKVGNNTYSWSRNGHTFIRLHRTDIVQIAPDGAITLDSNGWRTVTTKARMNEYLPAGVGVRQERGEWFLTKRAATGEWVDVPFYDGITV